MSPLSNVAAGPGTTAGASYLGGTGKRAPATRLGTLVVHDLVAAIVTGEVKPGELLPPETVLSEHFGVSRTVVRESVKRLEEKGMVTVAQGRGTAITPSAEWNILDRVVISTLIENDASLGILDELAVVRSALEAVMAGAVAGTHTDADVESLRAALTRMHEVVEDNDEFAAADIDFHARIMEISGQRLAQGISRTLVQRARDNARFYGAPGPDAPRLTLEEHTRVLDAIAAGDADAAAQAMRDHITLAWERRRITEA